MRPMHWPSLCHHLLRSWKSQGLCSGMSLHTKAFSRRPSWSAVWCRTLTGQLYNLRSIKALAVHPCFQTVHESVTTPYTASVKHHRTIKSLATSPAACRALRQQTFATSASAFRNHGTPYSLTAQPRTASGTHITKQYDGLVSTVEAGYHTNGSEAGTEVVNGTAPRVIVLAPVPPPLPDKTQQLLRVPGSLQQHQASDASDSFDVSNSPDYGIVGVDSEQQKLQASLDFAYKVSWVVNLSLVAAKAYLFHVSNSKAVMASLVDSAVDVASQVVIVLAAQQARKVDPRYPVGRARFEILGVLLCAGIMCASASEVLKEACGDLYLGWVQGVLPQVEMTGLTYTVLGIATALKLCCYFLCNRLKHQSDSMEALAEDHLNDIMSNIGAAGSAVIASHVVGAWWMDPSAALVISAIIVYRWYQIVRTQVDKIVGRAAPEQFIQQLQRIASSHHPDIMAVDSIKAYHFGSKFMVEMDVVMPSDMPLWRVHDLSLKLQMRLEALQQVERAFVHCDYLHRDQPEHRSERVMQGLPVLKQQTAE